MKWIKKIKCWMSGHRFSNSTLRYNPHTKLFSIACYRCGKKHFEKDEE